MSDTQPNAARTALEIAYRCARSHLREEARFLLTQSLRNTPDDEGLQTSFLLINQTINALATEPLESDEARVIGASAAHLVTTRPDVAINLLTFDCEVTEESVARASHEPMSPHEISHVLLDAAGRLAQRGSPEAASLYATALSLTPHPNEDLDPDIYIIGHTEGPIESGFEITGSIAKLARTFAEEGRMSSAVCTGFLSTSLKDRKVHGVETIKRILIGGDPQDSSDVSDDAVSQTRALFDYGVERFIETGSIGLACGVLTSTPAANAQWSRAWKYLQPDLPHGGPWRNLVGRLRPAFFDRYPKHAPVVRLTGLANDMVQARLERRYEGIRQAWLGPDDQELESPPETESTGPQPGPPRALNAWITDGEPMPRVGHRSTLWINIGTKRLGALAAEPFRDPPDPDWGTRSELELLVIVRSPDLLVEPAARELRLPRRGDSEALRFEVEPLRARDTTLRVSVFLSRGMSLLEEYAVDFPVQVESTEAVAR
jgi:hypothetical protein